MRPSDNIEKLINKLQVEPRADASKTNIDDALSVHKKTIGPAYPKPNIWRIFMKNQIIKLSVAAVIIIAVLMGVHYSGGSVDGAGVVWGGIIERVEQIPTVIVDMTVEITISEDEKRVLPSKNYIASDYGTRSDIFVEGHLMGIKYMLPIEKVAYQIDLDRKQYVRMELSDEQAEKARDSDDPRKWLKTILSGEYTKLGRATINGVVVEGIEAKQPQKMVDESSIMRLWVDVENNLPVQVEVEMFGMAFGQMRQHRYIMDNFQWNAEIDASIFIPEIPEDFTQIQ